MVTGTYDVEGWGGVGWGGVGFSMNGLQGVQKCSFGDFQPVTLKSFLWGNLL